MKGKIVIADYDPQWPQLYEQAKHRILQATNGLIIAIEHIGSTAVPGLAAKPIIDIMPGVKQLANADACIEGLVRMGYTYVPIYEDALPDRRYFSLHLREHKGYHIHMVEVGGDFWKRHLLFRDYLHAHPEAAQAYAQIKRKLAPQFTDTNDYASAKTEFITGMVAKAQVWKDSLIQREGG